MINITDPAKRIFGIGASGLIGSRVSELLKNTLPITGLSTATGVDITDPSTLATIARDTQHQYVILFAAKADVDGCEKDKDEGVAGDAWKINVLGAANVAKVCRESGKKLIYISTDFVFNGRNTPEGGYSEDDTPDPVNWYGMTKYEGERAVKESGVEYVIVRVAYPYRNAFEKKKDFAQAILGRLREGQPVKAVTDHVMTPTYVDDIAIALRTLIEKNVSGIYHVVGSEFITPYDASQCIAKEFGIAGADIEKTTLAEFFHDRATRPFNLALNNDKIERLGVHMRTFGEGLAGVHYHSHL